MKERDYFVYILASGTKGTLYIGVTSDLVRRIKEHRDGEYDGFTAKYRVTRLVHYEHSDDIWVAMQREKSLKKWRREWKITLIERDNPCWKDLYPDIVGPRLGGRG